MAKLGRIGTAALACTLVAVTLAACRPVPPGGGGPPWHRGGPELGPMVSGTASYVRGTYVWTDYVLDDRGPNLVDEPLLGPPRCLTPGGPDCSGGDSRYPDFAAPGNTADFVQLQIGKVLGQRLAIRAVLGTLVNPSLPVLGVAFDTDANPATGAASLPGGRWTNVDPLGVDHLIVAAHGRTELWRATGNTWHKVRVPFGKLLGHVDPKDNTIDVNVHASLLPRMSGSWRAFGVLGVQDPQGGSWVDGAQEIQDLAFVGDEPFVLWSDARQGDILAGPRVPRNDGLSSTHAAATIDFTKIDRRVTELADATSPGFHTYLYKSRLDLPEGVTNPNPAVSTQHEYLGPYQPYLVFIPENPPPGNPMTVWLHGANNNHHQSIFEQGFYVGTARAGSEDWYLVEMFQPDALVQVSLPPTIQISVLGRGETLGYQGISEIDVLEATDDAIARLRIDPNRVTIAGASMGGIGAYRLATLYPDRWAAAIPAIGTGASYRSLFPNLRNVPVRQMNGALDSAALGPATEADAVALDELEYDHHYWLGLDRGHELPGYYQCVFRTAIEKVRDPNPAEVVYRVEPDRFQHDPSRDVDITYTSAYWISALAVRDPGAGTVDAVSEARPRTEEVVTRTAVTRDNKTSGQDLCGPNPAFAPGWSPVHPLGESWRERSLTRSPGTPLPLRNALRLDLANLGTVTVDVARAGLSPWQDGEVTVVSDGPVRVTLTGLRGPTKVSIDGGAPSATWSRSVTMAIPAGEHRVLLDR